MVGFLTSQRHTLSNKRQAATRMPSLYADARRVTWGKCADGRNRSPVRRNHAPHDAPLACCVLRTILPNFSLPVVLSSPFSHMAGCTPIACDKIVCVCWLWCVVGHAAPSQGLTIFVFTLHRVGDPLRSEHWYETIFSNYNFEFFCFCGLPFSVFVRT